MANVGYYPGTDVAAAAELTGHTVAELSSDWYTDELLATLMQQYYEGSLAPIVNPGQGTRPPDEVWRETFVSGVGQDIASAGSQIAEATRALGTGLVSGVKTVTGLAGALPLILIVAGAAGVWYLIRRKA